jgi:hypothetical protein
MSYGIATFSENGTLSLHSDYSKLVFISKTVSANSTELLWKKGSGWTSYSNNAASKNSIIVGHTSYYEIDLGVDLSYICPFYKPAYYGQKVSPIEVYKVPGTTKWSFMLVHEGVQNPNIYVFGAMSELSITPSSDYGLEVTDENGNLLLSDQYKPLSIRDVKTITFPDVPPDNNLNSLITKPGSDVVSVGGAIDQNSMFSFHSTAVFGDTLMKVTPKKKRKCYIIACKTTTWNELIYWYSIHRASVKLYSPSSLEIGYLGYLGGKYFKVGPKNSSWSVSVFGWELVKLNDILKALGEFGDFITLGVFNLGDIFSFSGPSAPKMSVPMPLTTNYPTSIIIANSTDYD